jgi:hypothetical protein
VEFLNEEDLYGNQEGKNIQVVFTERGMSERTVT